MNSPPDFECIPFGERGWLARIVGFEDDVASGLFANAAADALRPLNGVTDAVAGIDSVTIRFDPTQIETQTAREVLCKVLTTVKAPDAGNTAKDIIDIPVLYGGDAGPDLADLCRNNRLSKDEFTSRHSSAVYRVITLGFAPGFTYLGPLHESLQAPRLATPRPRLPAGSVGIAGSFTGVYSLPSPGGWNIIGRTPVTLFDAHSDNPFIFRPGDSVRFQPIDAAEFQKISIRTV